MLYLFAILLLGLGHLHGVEEVKASCDSVSSQEGLPTNIVNQTCIISGQFVDHAVDMVIPGSEPLIFSRSYSSFDDAGNVGKGWFSNHNGQIMANQAPVNGGLNFFYLWQHSGSRLTYLHPLESSASAILNYRFWYPKGLTNGSLGEISGKTNLHNQKCYHHIDEKRFSVRDGEGNVRTYKKDRLIENQEWDALSYTPGFMRFAQSHEYKINGNCFKYEQADSVMWTKSIKCYNRETKQQYSNLEFEELPASKNQLIYRLNGDGDLEATYHFKREKNKHYYLEQVQKTYQPSESYEYKERTANEGFMLSKVKRPGARFLSIKHYGKKDNHLGGKIGTITIKEKDDYRLDRVRLLEGPVGTDSTPIVTHRFVYDAEVGFNKDHEKEVRAGTTDVYDAFWHKTSYEYTKEHRLSRIKKYNGKDKYSLFSQENFIWCRQGSSEEGNLRARYLEDHEGKIHHGRFFLYDDFGNVKTKGLWGALTGHPTANLQLDKHGNPISNGCEFENTSFTYSEDGLNLLLSETDCMGTKTLYDYKPGTNLLICKVLVDKNVIKKREYFTYDSNNTMIKKIMDDGSGMDQNDLSGVTERHITYIVPKKTFPVGLPKEIEEKYLDFSTGEEKLLKKTKMTYSKKGYLEKRDTYDCDGIYSFSNTWKYDDFGNCIEETNALGEKIIREYDENKNLISEEGPRHGFKIKNYYDFSNRLIKQEEIHDGKTYTIHHCYNYLNQCVATINAFGLETRFDYDDQGRLVKTHLPPMLNEKGEITFPALEKKYNVAGYLISSNDAKGRETKTDYNIRGQPIHIYYPDGTAEHFIYQLDGKLQQKIEKNGLKTVYARDYQGRVENETVYGADGQLLYTQAWTYNALHLETFVDKEGVTTSYDYDGAGRLHLTIKNGQVKEHFYDKLGRLAEIRETTDNGDYRRQLKKYDLLDRIIDEKVKSSDGTLFEHKRYGYDVQGNQILAEDAGEITTTDYNAHGQPIKVTNALGHSTHTVYKTDFINALNQQVLQTITTDPLGQRLIHTYDGANRLVEVRKENPFGLTFYHQTLFYDLCGNCCRIVDHLHENGKPIKNNETAFFYNEGDQVMAKVEAAFAPEQKITSYKYNTLGQKVLTIKPDGTELKYTYDPEGRMQSINSSDGTISYTYTYNLSGLVTQVIDGIHSQITECNYDKNGNLSFEKLGNGLTLHYTYDKNDRVKSMTFPDHSSIEYDYNAVDLKAIHRFKNGQKIYTHANVKHDLKGRPVQILSPGQTSPVAIAYDKLHRPISIENALFKQSIPKNGYDAANNLISFQTQNHSTTLAYDPLYQLEEEKGIFNHTYTCDSLSNRLQHNGILHVHNSLNQLLKKGDEAYHYDPNGNLLKKKNTTLAYDALDRLVAITCDGVTTHYTYDAFNRRLTKKTPHSEQHFFYQGHEEIGAWQNGQITELKIPGQGDRSLSIALEIDQKIYIPIHDLFGNIALLQNLNGEVIESYCYSAFGETQIFSQGEKIQQSSIGNPWQYASKRLDNESGLVAFGLRYYQPELGRWLTKDPAEYCDGSNLYAYVHHSPLVFHDELGLFSLRNDFMPAAAGTLHGCFDFLAGYAYSIQSSAFAMGCESLECHDYEERMQIRQSFMHAQNNQIQATNTFIQKTMGGDLDNSIHNSFRSRTTTTLEIYSILAGAYGIAKGVIGVARISAGLLMANLAKQALKQEAKIATKGVAEVAKKAGRKRFVPDNLATDAHTVFRRDPVTGKVTHYETFVPQTNPRNPNRWQSMKRYDGPGSDEHWNKVLKKDIFSPHIHDPTYPGGVREAHLWEIPNN